MSREEAIDIILNDINTNTIREGIALNMAIKALEQKLILDKIRAEIRKKMKFNSFNEGYVLFDDITEVLDKYKVE